MRLLDQVMQAPHFSFAELADDKWMKVPGAGSFAASLSACPIRFVLQDAVFAACHELLSDLPDMLDPFDPLTRFPGESLWIEWMEPLQCSGTGTMRAGCLVECDETGRRGSLRQFWHQPEYGVVPAQGHLVFDFVGRNVDPALGGNGIKINALGEASRFGALFEHCCFVPAPEWIDYDQKSGVVGDAAIDFTLRRLQSVAPSLLLALAFAKLLGLRNCIDHRPVDQTSLNKNRIRRGAPELLDHIEAHLDVGHNKASGSRGARDQNRSAPRLHLVRGHLVARAGKLFWRKQHARGHLQNSPVLSRTTTVTLRGNSAALFGIRAKDVAAISGDWGRSGLVPSAQLNV
jgi:hypothetical protein